ncbi:MmcQ/YjbR family DNA-binding protein [Streptomyces sp. NPDC088785]|uniref:MmcQ/YjbR family DNA-binding protein n=1 Tax=Streptomyces sp. NPDC088785 TaxID=3365897 RepID=UPI00382C9A63
MAERSTPSRKTLRTWERVREFALGLPGATEEFPWGESALKVHQKVFAFLGVTDGSHPMGMTVKLTDEETHAHALTAPGAAPARYGLGRSGWVRIPLEEKGVPDTGLLCDWVEESYRAIAPKRRLAELDADRAAGAPPEIG